MTGSETERIVEIGSQDHTCVVSVDEPGHGGAHHEYRVRSRMLKDATKASLAIISFQNGSIREAGVNGCHHEDLIAIVLDRLRAFQKGDYACRENAIAITKLEEALHRLNDRTADRDTRGVKGTSVK